MSGPYRSPAEDPELTEEEAEGIRRAMGQAERGEVYDLEEIMGELAEELDALEHVRARRAG
ncbi:hypothetical protein [Pendulispora albinea]|uniref:Uncharacterized protein n=1 Tax=Pendulispora albinea TaxID=2741071 RepID=A0ABZ2LTD8_9BACT